MVVAVVMQTVATAARLCCAAGTVCTQLGVFAAAMYSSDALSGNHGLLFTGATIVRDET